jgi:hypothetical protein
MRDHLIGALYALASAFVAVLLPMTTIGAFRHPTNLLLGFIFGFGWFVGGFVENVRSPNVETVGWLIWPLLMMGLITWLLGRLLSNYPDRKAAIAAASIVLLLAIVPGDLVSTTFLKYVPTYSSILLSIY